MGSKVYVAETRYDDQRIGAAAVYCSDGRFGEQMDEFLHSGLKLPRYDRLAVPGGAACVAAQTLAYYEAKALDRQLGFLVREHGLRRVVLIAHDGCAFYGALWAGWRPIEEQQAQDLRRAAEHIRLWSSHVVVEAYFARKVEGRVEFERWDDGWPQSP
jgi:hypothetical protein